MVAESDSTKQQSPPHHDILKDIPDHHHDHPREGPLNFRFEKGDIAYHHFKESGLWIQSMEGPGSRTHLFRGFSLAGQPTLQPRRWSGTDPRQLPFGVSGLYSKDQFYYDPGLELHGAIGSVKTREPPFQFIPKAAIQWERGPYAGNAFQMEFERLMTDQVHLGLDLQSRSTDSLGLWAYQDAVHQPYVNSLERDSSRIPFVGRNLDQEQLLMTPWIDIKMNEAHLRYTGNFLHIDNQEAENRLISPDPLSPYTQLNIDARAFEVLNKESSHRFDFTSARLWGRHLNLSYASIARRVERTQLRTWSTKNKVGTLRDEYIPGETTQRESIQRLVMSSQEAELYPNLRRLENQSDTTLGPLLQKERPHWDYWIPHVHMESERRIITDYSTEVNRTRVLKDLDEDFQLAYLQWTKSDAKLQLGLQRMSLIRQEEQVYTAASVQYEPHYKDHWGEFHLQSYASQRYQAASINEREIWQRGRFWHTNPDLKTSRVRHFKFRPTYDFNHNNWGFGFFTSGELELTKDAVAPQWILNRQLGDSISSDLSMRSIRFDEGHNQTIEMGMRVRLGHWSAIIKKIQARENYLVLGSTKFQAHHLPRSLYQGQLAWRKVLLSRKNLGIALTWDWNWIGPRKEWYIVNSQDEVVGFTQAGEEYAQTRYYASEYNHPHYLALDFEARMKISTFELYYKMNNFNHSLQSTQVGYTPPGLNFRWGVVWSFEG